MDDSDKKIDEFFKLVGKNNKLAWKQHEIFTEINRVIPRTSKWWIDNIRRVTNSTIVIKKNSRDGILISGYAIKFPQSILRYDCYYIDDMTRNGWARIYDINNHIIVNLNYEMDKIISGTYSQYYPSGEPYTSEIYINNDLNGEFIAYHVNGKISWTGQYINGVPVGLWIEYSDIGEVIRELHF